MNLDILLKAANLRSEATKTLFKKLEYSLSDPCDGSVVSRHIRKREQELGAMADLLNSLSDGFEKMSYKEDDDEE